MSEVKRQRPLHEICVVVIVVFWTLANAGWTSALTVHSYHLILLPLVGDAEFVGTGVEKCCLEML